MVNVVHMSIKQPSNVANHGYCPTPRMHHSVDEPEVKVAAVVGNNVMSDSTGRLVNNTQPITCPYLTKHASSHVALE